MISRKQNKRRKRFKRMRQQIAKASKWLLIKVIEALIAAAIAKIIS